MGIDMHNSIVGLLTGIIYWVEDLLGINTEESKKSKK